MSYTKKVSQYRFFDDNLSDSSKVTSSASAFRTTQHGRSPRFVNFATGTGGSNLLLIKASTMPFTELWSPSCFRV